MPWPLNSKDALGAALGIGLLATTLAAAMSAASAQEFLSPVPMAPQKMRTPSRPTATPAPAPAPAPAQMPTSASADQPPTNAAPRAADLVQLVGDWKLTCEKVPTRRCIISQRRVDPKTQAVLIWAEIAKGNAPSASDYQVSIMVPLGLKIQGMHVMAADRQEIINLPVYACIAAGCIYEAKLQEPIIRKIQDQPTLSTPFVAITGQPFVFGLTTNGLRDALMKMNLYLKIS